MMKRERGFGRTFQRGGVWWIAYYVDGKERRESVGKELDDKTGLLRPKPRGAAVDLLKQRHREQALGTLGADEAPKLLLRDLRKRIEDDYVLQERRSSTRLGQLWAHLENHLGKDTPAVNITSARLDSYVAARLGEKAARGTIKNELNALRRAFKLSERRAGGTLDANDVPVFPKIKVSDPRKGFFEREEHERVRAALPSDQGDVAEFLFWTGWRTSEAKGLEWPNVDEAAGVIRIDTSKSGEPRTLPYAALPALAALIKHRRQVTDAVQKKRGIIVRHVFHRNGDEIQGFRRAWATACVAAGLGREIRHPDVKDAAGKVVKRGKLIKKELFRQPHDYRRSAARNLSRAGVPEGVIMKLCGWKTRVVFDRYRIVAERDLREGLERLAGAAPSTASNVAPMRRKRR